MEKEEKIIDFIKSFEKYNDVEDFINKKGRNVSIQGSIYERLWDIVIKFLNPKIFLSRLIETNNKYYIKHINNKNINTIKDINLDKYFTKFNGKIFRDYLNNKSISGNSGGFSDITFSINDIYFLSSSKYFTKEDTIHEYDIEKLCVIIEKNNTHKIRCLLFIKNKQEFYEKIKRSNKSSSILIEYIRPFEKNVFDLNDLKPLYLELKKLFEYYNYFKNENDIKIFISEYLKDDGFKPLLNLRFHQKLFINQIRKIRNKEKKCDILMGAVPRCGKTFIMGGCILDYLKNLSKKTGNNFIIITSAPSETIQQYKDMFDTFLDFESNHIITHIIGIKEIKEKDFSLDINKNNVVLISIQKLVKEKIIKKDKDNYIEELDEEKYNKYINLLKEYKFEIIFIDEAHHGQTTEKAIKVLKTKLKYNYRIFTTATFRKPIETYKISNLLFWSLENLIDLKRLNDSFFDINQFNDIIKKIVENCNFTEDTINEVFKELKVNITDKNDITQKILKQYKNFPEPFYITTIWNNFDEIYKHIELAKDTNYSFDMKRIFSLDKDKKTFANKEEVKELFCFYLGIPRQTFLKQNKEVDLEYKFRSIYKETGIIPRIKNICNIMNCRTYQYNNKQIQLWFLPFGNGLRLIYLMNSIINLFATTNEFKYFFNNTFFILAKGNEKNIKNNYENVEYYDNSKGLKEFIINKQQELNDNNKYTNIVILTGFKLHLGVSLPDVDIVVLFNQIQSVDLLYQMMFRSMTEVNEENNKKYGFIVDLNPQRNIAFLNYDFNTIVKRKNDIIDNENKRILITDLFNIDRDKFIMDFDDKIKSKKDLIIYQDKIKKYSNELFKKLEGNNNYNKNENYFLDIQLKDFFDEIFKNKKLMKLYNDVLKDYNENKKCIKEDLEKRGVELENKQNLKKLDDSNNENDEEDNYEEDNDDNECKENDDNKIENKIKIFFKDVIIKIISFLSVKSDIKECCYMIDNYKKFTKKIKDILKNEIENNEEIKNIFVYTINDRTGLNIKTEVLFDILYKTLEI